MGLIKRLINDNTLIFIIQSINLTLSFLRLPVADNIYFSLIQHFSQKLKGELIGKKEIAPPPNLSLSPWRLNNNSHRPLSPQSPYTLLDINKLIVNNEH